MRIKLRLKNLDGTYKDVISQPEYEFYVLNVERYTYTPSEKWSEVQVYGSDVIEDSTIETLKKMGCVVGELLPGTNVRHIQWLNDKNQLVTLIGES